MISSLWEDLLLHSIAKTLAYLTVMVSLLLMTTPAAAECTASAQVRQMGPLKVGETVPTFAGFTMSGQQLTRDDLLKPPGEQPPPEAVVLSFFASWCVPCKVGLPIVQDVVRSSAPEARVHGLLISVYERGAIVKETVSKLGLKMMVLEDGFGTVSERLGVVQSRKSGGSSKPEGSLPRTVVLDGQGRVQGIFKTECEADFKDSLSKLVGQAVAATRKASP